MLSIPSFIKNIREDFAPDSQRATTGLHGLLPVVENNVQRNFAIAGAIVCASATAAILYYARKAGIAGIFGGCVVAGASCAMVLTSIEVLAAETVQNRAKRGADPQALLLINFGIIAGFLLCPTGVVITPALLGAHMGAKLGKLIAPATAPAP